MKTRKYQDVARMMISINTRQGDDVQVIVIVIVLRSRDIKRLNRSYDEHQMWFPTIIPQNIHRVVVVEVVDTPVKIFSPPPPQGIIILR